MTTYKCPHCLGGTIEPRPGFIVCDGDKHCGFSGGPDEFEHVEPKPPIKATTLTPFKVIRGDGPRCEWELAGLQSEHNVVIMGMTGGGDDLSILVQLYPKV